MRVVTYRRVSSSDQAESGLSLDEQNTRMDAWCSFMGFSVVERFIDSGISGFKKVVVRVSLRVLTWLGRSSAMLF